MTFLLTARKLLPGDQFFQMDEIPRELIIVGAA